MKICTFPNCAYLSETSRMIELYKEMKSRGEEVVMATHGGPYEWLFKEEGIEYNLVTPHFSNERARDFVLTNTGEKGLAEFYTVEELDEHVGSEIQFFKEQNIKKIVTGFTLSCAISARALKIPYYVTHLGSFVPPVFEKKMLVPTLVTNFKIFKVIPRSWLVNLVNGLMYKSKMATKSFNKVAVKYGVEPFMSMEEIMMGDVIVVTDVPEILTISKEEIENWKPEGKYKKYYNHPVKLRYGGAIFAKLFGDASDEILNFLDTDKTKIYVALTSGQSAVIERVYEGIKDLDAKIVILSTVHKIKETSHDNILVVDHLPSHKVMPLMDVAIIHGGQGSVQTAIDAGTPIVGIPLHVEQGLNVANVEKHGAGIMQIKHDIDPEEVREKVERILGDISYKENMKKLSIYQKQVDGVVKAVDIILE
ncbi:MULTISPECIES: glycosyltransferase [Psychrilyobacter]|uniref:Erythromycin biosynthesis protein CIII-like C-terminal domain-containing protein n=1 Tax=Psychrilyobacter piezotolerans TaxID=2293438 RepID=A0ABX9KID2_9FUSO|nr:MULTISPECIES: nucleotide disphospho-sugar-binding domain-containing protein [Psychrilyobacter]MCS5421361.1 hypothetical protein [Psychrilyobacter sp. S5]NDI77492.1 hypothetical protein [Psychrilyobacter piezotolerans]RDE62994.1 hypothetical protein DV867_06305 [Psychrilyobacter sp. S5]REI41752.1 hypothetical protein DYH56_06305 [Psychrilyobacter piezotolerans]